VGRAANSSLELPFYFVDVFTTEPLSGNPLAVVAGADAVPERVMGQIAREFNQSETTFVVPARRPDARWRLRSFTPAGVEVFGAGHNALGAWWWLAETGQLELVAPSVTFGQELGDRVLPVEIRVEDDRPTEIVMTQEPPDFGATVADTVLLARALRLSAEEIDLTAYPARAISTGVAHLMVPVRDLSALERIIPDAEVLVPLLAGVRAEGCYAFTTRGLPTGVDARARFFNPGVGIGEDPATGTAAGPLACLLAMEGLPTDGRTFVIEQGHQVGRPSRILVNVRGRDVTIAARARVVASGTLHLGA
jgi:PhzF family phenazine biosynthesis protein